MNIIHLPCAIRNDYYTIKVVFNNTGSTQSKPYTYRVRGNVKLEQLDEVVVPTKYGIKIAQVWKVDEFIDINYASPYEYNWIIQKVDKAEFNKLVAQDQEIVEEGRKQEHIMRHQQAREFLAKAYGNSFVDRFKNFFVN